MFRESGDIPPPAWLPLPPGLTHKLSKDLALPEPWPLALPAHLAPPAPTGHPVEASGGGVSTRTGPSWPEQSRAASVLADAQSAPLGSSASALQLRPEACGQRVLLPGETAHRARFLWAFLVSRELKHRPEKDASEGPRPDS